MNNLPIVNDISLNRGGYAVSATGKDTVGALCLDDYKGPNRQYVDQDKLILQYYLGDTDGL